MLFTTRLTVLYIDHLQSLQRETDAERRSTTPTPKLTLFYDGMKLELEWDFRKSWSQNRLECYADGVGVGFLEER